MNTYTLTSIEETTIIDTTIMTTTYQIPFDSNGNPVTDYTFKFRIITNGQMLVFDTEQEYRDWLQQNT